MQTLPIFDLTERRKTEKEILEKDPNKWYMPSDKWLVIQNQINSIF